MLAATGAQATADAAGAEFDRQVTTLVQHGYPAAAGLTETGWRSHVEPLRAAAISLDPGSDHDRGEFGFVIVVQDRLVPSAASIALVRRRDTAGFLSMLTPEELATSAPIEPVELPDAAA